MSLIASVTRHRTPPTEHNITGLLSGVQSPAIKDPRYTRAVTSVASQLVTGLGSAESDCPSHHISPAGITAPTNFHYCIAILSTVMVPVLMVREPLIVVYA
jgi:hypothetical protein